MPLALGGDRDRAGLPPRLVPSRSPVEQHPRMHPAGGLGIRQCLNEVAQGAAWSPWIGPQRNPCRLGFSRPFARDARKPSSFAHFAMWGGSSVYGSPILLAAALGT